ncbi:citramalate synthase [Egibacter rhizosphaerae]|uniref:Citramalate synthase n=1 Tax=Egibacter rhizosphaerae TaxID=1670831 RepID=A0A411YCY4_9ACTN|nr:citramalate synthase [Egibacter rhizosphaerae]QBI19007.1 citramalate synthase [Egibacter rhizosphaerae]
MAEDHVAESPGRQPDTPLPAWVDLYDTTLRDGTQREGITPTVDDKLRIARLIDGLGVPFIEGGWPGANPKDTEFFARAAKGELPLERAELVAFGMTRRPDRDASGDPSLGTLLEAATPVVCLVGKAWSLHVTEAVGTTKDENLAMIADSVRLLRSEGRRVLFDAEHFFDGHRNDPDYALAVLEAAAEAGAECLVLCDTNGGMLPEEVERVTGGVVGRFGGRGGTQIGVHVHNDTECAVANSLAGLRAGATHVQGTVNGIGERCGNANLCSLIPNLKLKYGIDVVGDTELGQLTTVANEVAETMNLIPDPHAPYVGHAAFAHKAGLHTSALQKNPMTYQHIDPAKVGGELRLLMSELAGRSTIVMKGEQLGIDLGGDGDLANRILGRVKDLEHAGYSFEAADASFELLVADEAGTAEDVFRLEGFRAIVERREDGSPVAEGTVRVWVRDETAEGGWSRRIGVGEGNGPVDALDQAFRHAVNGQFPDLDRIHLADYKVRIVDPQAGTGATTRVLVSSSDGEREWQTVGVSENVIDASWKAMADAYRYGLAGIDGPG